MVLSQLLYRVQHDQHYRFVFHSAMELANSILSLRAHRMFLLARMWFKCVSALGAIVPMG